MIQKASSVILYVPNPRPFKFVGVHHCAFKGNTYLVVICHTADGKSLIPQIVGILQPTVCIYLVPLIGLGSDQVERAMVIEQNIEPYHVDKHKNEDARLLITCLEQMTKEEAKYVTIKLFLGPNTMTSTRWGPVLEKLARRRGLISFFCIDEAHKVEQGGRHFRPEFKKVVAVISQLIKLMSRPCSRILLSTTLH